MSETSFSIGNPNFLFYRLLSVTIANCISLILNLILLLLVIKKSTLHLRPYKKVLIATISIDLQYTIVSIFNDFLFFVVDDHYYVVPFGNMPMLPEPFYFFGMCWMLFSMYLLFTTIPVQFVYRCNLILRGKELSVKKFLGLLLIPVSYTFAYTVHFAFMVYPRDTDVEEFGGYFIRMNWTNEKGEVPKFYATQMSNPAMLHARIAAGIILTSAYVASGICAVLIAKRLREEFKHMHESISILQKQITKVLMIQTAAPLVTLIGPMMIHVFLPNSTVTALIAMILFTWSPVCNPIIALTVLTPYRKQITSAFSTVYQKSMAATTSIWISSRGARVAANSTIPKNDGTSFFPSSNNAVTMAETSAVPTPSTFQQTSL